MKKVQLDLMGLNGNAFSLLSHFSESAKRQGWDEGGIDRVLQQAMAGDYRHLLRTLDAHCVPAGEP